MRIVTAAMSLGTLERTRDEIECFSPIHQRQIYELLLDGAADLQETSQGVLVNMGTLSDELLESITAYAKYVKDQEVRITRDEKAKDELRENYFGTSAEQA